jgi:hypothetical protein
MKHQRRKCPNFSTNSKKLYLYSNMQVSLISKCPNFSEISKKLYLYSNMQVPLISVHSKYIFIH